MSDKLRTGIIGCGGMARNHIGGYLECGRFEIAALADSSEEAMLECDALFGGQTGYGSKKYDDPRLMLDSEELDVVSVCTWHRTHATWTIAAAARRPKAILCEKPMAEDLGRADEMRMVCERNGVKLAIAHQRRFLPAYVMARDLIAEGAIGKVELLHCQAAYGLPNWSTHHADMFRFLLGSECAWVMGSVERRTDRMERGTRIEDRAVGAFGFENGARAVLLSDLTEEFYQGAQIYGTEGMIDLQTERLRLLSARTAGKWETFTPDGRFFKANADRFEWVEGAAAQADELADWVEGKIPLHRGEAINGYRALEIVMAVYESARLHERVVLPLETRVNPLDEMVRTGHLPVLRPGTYDIRAPKLRGEAVLYDETDERRG